MQHKYGVDNASQLKVVQELKRKKRVEKFGNGIQQTVESRLKREETCLKKYGTRNPIQNKQVLEKAKKTLLSRYGVECTFHSKEIKEKIKKSILQKYGVDNVSKSEKIKNKKILTSLKKYKTKHPLKNKKIYKKLTDFLLNRYGVTNLSKIPNVQKKKLETRYKNGKLIKVFDTQSKTLISLKDISNKYQWSYSHLIRVYKLLGEEALQVLMSRKKIYINSYIQEVLCSWIDEVIKIPYIKNDRKLLNGKEIDIYFPKYKLGIEINGRYYHSTKFKSKHYHINKTNAAKDAGIRLLHILDIDFLNKEDIIKNIIKSNLNIFTEHETINNCKIIVLNKSQYKNFIKINDISPYRPANIMLGLVTVNTNKLISVLSLNRLKNSSYSIVSFCKLQNIKIKSDLQALFSYFIQEYNPSSVHILVNRDFFTGNYLLGLGFKEHGYILNKASFLYNNKILTSRPKNIKKYKYLTYYNSGYVVYYWSPDA